MCSRQMQSGLFEQSERIKFVFFFVSLSDGGTVHPGLLHLIPDCQQVPGYGCMDDLTTERSFASQDTWVINVVGLLSDMLAMGLRTTRHWQTSGRLVQELNVCTVYCTVYSRLKVAHGINLFDFVLPLICFWTI